MTRMEGVSLREGLSSETGGWELVRRWENVWSGSIDRLSQKEDKMSEASDIQAGETGKRHRPVCSPEH